MAIFVEYAQNSMYNVVERIESIHGCNRFSNCPKKRNSGTSYPVLTPPNLTLSSRRSDWKNLDTLGKDAKNIYQ